MTSLIADRITVDFPIYASQRSLRKALFERATGGKVERGEGRHQSRLVVKALSDISFELQDGDRLRGFHLHTPWGPGPTVASDPDAGLALLDAAQRRDESIRVGIPDANTAAVRAMHQRGYEEVAGTERMRLGPPVEWRPDLVFGVFNPFWG